MSTTNWTQVAGMTGDVEVENVQDFAETATEKAAEAAASATSASTSASSASSSASSASSSASSASTSATNASNSASSASTSASNASTSATAAQTAKNAAELAETNAETAQAAAEAAQTAAETAQTAAETAETNAGTSETNAATSASSAATSASTATTKASEASTSASNAATSETNAATSASAASTSETNAATSASNASTSETNASTSASAAATSATNASTSETNASNSATAAATSASGAATSATSAAASAASAASALDNFDDRYLGAKSADPALDNDGDALITGALYFNTTDGVMRIYTASGWIDASSSSVATMQKYKFTATSGQTVFSGTDDDAETLSLTVGAEMVTLNGVVLEAGTDYTVTSSSITLASGATTSDELNVYAFGNFLVADTVSASTGGTFQAEVTFDGGAKFNDNDKAIFGAGSDLQIYHDGSDSYIRDNAEGVLRIQGAANVQIEGANEENMAVFNQDEGVFLYYDGANTFSTTATGVNVTGTVTADGLTVDGNIKLDGNGRTLQVDKNVSGTDNVLYYDNTVSTNDLYIGRDSSNLRLRTNSQNRLLIDSDGDISFYEDTGVTPKFFWDASAESLGIGGNFAQGKLLVFGSGSVNGHDVGIYTYEDGANTSSPYFVLGSQQGAALRAVNTGTYGRKALVFYTSDNTGTGTAVFTPTERMRIDASGNVGIGTTPSGNLNLGYVLRLNGGTQTYLAFNNDTHTTQTTGGFVIGHDSANAYITQRENQPIIFSTNNTEAMRINSGGNLVFPNGKGIDFSASAGGGATSSLLDDYEEGTFTVGFTGGTVSAGNTTGYYTKIGNVVHWNYYSSSTNISGASGIASITGLPFTVINSTPAEYTVFATTHNTFFGGSTTEGVLGYHSANTTTARFITTGTTNSPSFTNGTTLYLMVSGTYRTAS